ncbi:hypothetical protein ASPBRDRAFT_136536 [Aspergillus brasiliensis CBS 101740]|uniref:Aminoglycoside phosphotransferase domain-containing protein n=1 Tax=Aspergillus brasiliensis (strain CBS 101740 / IMI 381727 / IBT 21946) TaxID=767769 RepID=A0A1L9U620_ASPBC|nr:hypothetical protein ASPBRDRAFT_136536 [Aspergillus brasiliensis CBS 101740]
MTPSNACIVCGWEPESPNACGCISQVKVFHQTGDIFLWSLGSEVVLKDRGKGPPTDEASIIQFVQEQTSIPVPKVLKNWKEDDHKLIMMDVTGQPLNTIWPSLSFEQRQSIAKQTVEYLLELRQFQSDRMQSLDGGPVFDNSFFVYWDDRCPRGPFASDDELWAEMERRLPECVSEAVRNQLRSLMPPSTPYTLTHGDLSSNNIMVKDGRVTGIIDWETAAYMPVWWEAVSGSIAMHGLEDEEWRDILQDEFAQGYESDQGPAFNFWTAYLNLCVDPLEVQNLDNWDYREDYMDDN